MMKKILIFLLAFTSVIMVVNSQTTNSKESYIEYYFLNNTDTSSLFSSKKIINLNKEQALRFLIDTLNNENVLLMFESPVTRIRAGIKVKEIIIYIESISDDLVPYLIQLLDDEERNWAANILLYHKSKCTGSNLLYFSKAGYREWQKSERYKDRVKWNTWEWD